jgi:hypothetical protein
MPGQVYNFLLLINNTIIQQKHINKYAMSILVSISTTFNSKTLRTTMEIYRVQVPTA